jgi:hypothetical protein
MAEEALSYAVLLASPESLKPLELAQALAPVLQRPVVDLTTALRRCWGLVETNADEAKARAEAKALEAAGMPALAVPSKLLEDLPAAEPLTTPSVPGPIALIAAGAFTQRNSRTVTVEQGPTAGQRALGIGITLATGLPPSLFGVGGKKKVEKRIESSELLYFADVYAGTPLRRWRLDYQRFDYSCLGEQKGYDTTGNFRKVLQQLSAGAAKLNVGARGILNGTPVRTMGYDSIEDLEREARWHLTLAALGR